MPTDSRILEMIGNELRVGVGSPVDNFIARQLGVGENVVFEIWHQLRSLVAQVATLHCTYHMIQGT